MTRRVKAHGWAQLEVDDRLPKQFRDADVRVFRKGECMCIVGLEPRPGDTRSRWHLSISCRDRYPTWEEIKDARESLLPLGLYFAQILPPSTDYVNVHPNCFHLWEIEWQTP